MKAEIHPSVIKGNLLVPASKSAGQRALVLGLLHKGRTILNNLGESDDEKAALEFTREMGATIKADAPGRLVISSAFGKKTFSEINCGESGLGVRMITPVAALQNEPFKITGSGSLLNRPMLFFDNILPQLGVRVETNEGRLPMYILGPLKPRTISIDGSMSSQFLTGLLVAFAATCTETVEIHVKQLTSRPYIDLTLNMLSSFGYKVVNHDYEIFEITPVNQDLRDIEFTVESDWSSASFLLAAGAINGSMLLRGLDLSSTQGDKEILSALSAAGVSLSVRPDEIEVRRSAIRPFHFNATQCPDLFPPLVAIASYAHGKSVIEGAGRLIHKESNRALTLQQEFGKLGIEIVLQDDFMIIEGGRVTGSSELDSHHDHRIAMALTVAASAAEGPSVIQHAEAVAKSYPGFFIDMKKSGLLMEDK